MVKSMRPVPAVNVLVNAYFNHSKQTSSDLYIGKTKAATQQLHSAEDPH
jgi:hypothetical protein